MSAITSLPSRIERAHEKLTDRPQPVYLVFAAEKWRVLVGESREGARLVGCFSRTVDPIHFAQCVHKTLEEMRPG